MRISFNGCNELVDRLLVLKGGDTVPKRRCFFLAFGAEDIAPVAMRKQGQGAALALACQPGQRIDAIIAQAVIFRFQAPFTGCARAG